MVAAITRTFAFSGRVPPSRRKRGIVEAKAGRRDDRATPGPVERVPVGAVGDAYDRYLVRLEEMRQSVHILRQVIAKLPSGPITVQDPKNLPPEKPKVLMKMEELIHHFIIHTEGVNAPPGEVYFSAENPKGELGFYINSRGGGVPHRLKIRAPSFVNLSILPKILPGHMMSDVVAILGSLDFVMGESDR